MALPKIRVCYAWEATARKNNVVLPAGTLDVPPSPILPFSLETTPTMSKYILSMVAMLVYMAGTAHADESISANTLADMGLSGITVMSDSDALAVRGLGFRGGDHSKGCSNCGIRTIKSPWSAVAGNSFATIGVEGGGAHSENGYAAEGAYAASGENYSEAAREISNVEIINIDGVVKSVTTVCTTRVYAAGSSSAMSF